MAKFVKGQSGNPAGKPLGTRNKLVESFVTDLQEKWRTDGADILDRLAVEEPAKLVEAISRLAPKDVAVTLEQRNSLGVDPVLWARFQGVMNAVEECMPEGMTAIDVLDTLEQMVRSQFAKQIDHS